MPSGKLSKRMNKREITKKRICDISHHLPPCIQFFLLCFYTVFGNPFAQLEILHFGGALFILEFLTGFAPST